MPCETRLSNLKTLACGRPASPCSCSRPSSTHLQEILCFYQHSTVLLRRRVPSMMRLRIIAPLYREKKKGRRRVLRDQD
jgi:hypothetical protein